MMRSFLLFSLVLLVSLSAVAQGPDPGTPPFESFAKGSFDAVNQGNLNVYFAIPVLKKAGRGLPFNYALSYSSSIWYPAIVSGSKKWQPVTNWGWPGQTQMAIGYLSFNTTMGSCGMGWLVFIFDGFVYHDPSGTNHAFPGQAIASQCTGISNLTTTSLDGSGYRLFFNANTATGT